MRALIAVTLCLLLSLAANVWQYGRTSKESGREEIRTQLDGELARVHGIVGALEETAGRNAVIADAARLDNTVLLADLGRIVDRGRERITVYRDRIAAAPELTCAPGFERMDAINGILGGDR